MLDTRSICWALAAAALVSTAAACSDDVVESSATPIQSESSPSTPAALDASVGDIEGLVGVGGRSLYVRCTGSGSPTIMLEGGDEDTSSSYSYAEADLAAVTRTCVYDRANLGSSDADPGPRGLAELVADFEGVLKAANIPGPYVLVGTSGGGYISAGYAVEHRRQVAGIVFVEVPAPFRNPPAPIVADTRWDSPVNIENRDYLQVEKDAWAARTRIGDIPVTVMSNEYSADEIAAARVPVGASGDAHQRQRPARLAGAQPQRQASRRSHWSRHRRARP